MSMHSIKAFFLSIVATVALSTHIHGSFQDQSASFALLGITALRNRVDTQFAELLEAARAGNRGVVQRIFLQNPILLPRIMNLPLPSDPLARRFYLLFFAYLYSLRIQ